MPALTSRPRGRDGSSARPSGSALAIGRDHWLVDVALVVVVFAPSLFTTVIGKLTPMLMMASLPAVLWLRHERLPAVAARCWPLLLLPLFALLSTLWSVRPDATAYYAFLYCVTVTLGILLGAALERDATLIGLFVALQSFNVLSFFLGRVVDWGGGRMGSTAFAGLSGSKNAAGDFATLGLLVTMATVALALKRRWWPLLAVAAVTLPLTMWIQWNAHATGALIAGVVSAFCLLLWLLSAGLPLTVRSAILALVSLAVVGAVMTQSVWLPPLFELVLTSSGKDAGLTGRAELWRKADYLIALRPWLGLGYNGFWQIGNLDAEALWRTFGVTNRIGFHFHNTVRQVTVDLGYVGLTLYALPAVVATGSNFARALRTTDPLQTLACALSVYIAMELGFEVIGFSTLNHTTVLVFLILSLGLRRDRPTPTRNFARSAIDRA